MAIARGLIEGAHSRQPIVRKEEGESLKWLETPLQNLVRWRKHGFMSSMGCCFDIGTTTKEALDLYDPAKPEKVLLGLDLDAKKRAEGEPVLSAGNGSLMRLAPIPLFYHDDVPVHTKTSSGVQNNADHRALLQSEMTHGDDLAGWSCALMTKAILRALKTNDKKCVYEGICGPDRRVNEALGGAKTKKKVEEISGEGLATKSLEAALWCFINTESFEEGVLQAVNLGDDTDTTAAIYGQLAGAFYGYKAIPEKWRSAVIFPQLIDAIAHEIYKMAHLGAKEPSIEYIALMAAYDKLEEAYNRYLLSRFNGDDKFKSQQEVDKAVMYFEITGRGIKGIWPEEADALVAQFKRRLPCELRKLGFTA